MSDGSVVLEPRTATIGGHDARIIDAPGISTWAVMPHLRRETLDSPGTSVREGVVRIVRFMRATDAVAVGVAAAVTAALVVWPHELALVTSSSIVALAILGSMALWVPILTLARAYEPRFLFSGSAEIHRLGVAGAAMAMLATSVGWVSLEKADAPVVLGGVAAALAATIGGRWLIRMRVQHAHRRGVARSRVVLVGDPDELPDIIGRLRRNRYHGWDVVASMSLDTASVADDRVETIVGCARRQQADVVLLATSGAAGLRSIVDLQRALHAESRDLALAPPLVEAVGPRVSVDTVCGLPIIRISPPELRGPRRIVKSVADRAAAALALAVAGPLLLMVALLIRLDSSGPAIFRQCRVGRDGRLFTIWKFRSMYVDAEARRAAIENANEGAGPLFKMRRDPRVTRVGGLLRRTSLDELPQIVNILTGDMSFVGPRPALPREVDEYDSVTRRRLFVRPGLTGLWQIHGRSDLSWEETKRLDVRYVENWSLGFDLSILMRTVDAVLRGRGAY